MAGIIAPVAGELVACAGSAILAPTIDRFKRGRQIARTTHAVYIPGGGKMIEFQSSESNRLLYRDYLKREKWITQYLKPPVINLAELASALMATKLISVPPSSLSSIENSVMVLGTSDPVRKLEGVMLAFQKGFLNIPENSQQQNSVPWKLLHDALCPAETWRSDPKLLEIWFALHCEHIFPIPESRVIAASDTLRRIRTASSGPRLVVSHNGNSIPMHFEVPLEKLQRIAACTDLSLLRGPKIPPVSLAVRVAGMLGGARTLELLGDKCAQKVMSALLEVEKAKKFDLIVKQVDEGYVIETSCSQMRAESNFRALGARQFELNIHNLKTITFTNCNTVQGSLILRKRLDELSPEEVFHDVENVRNVCQKVDQSMALNKRTSRYGDECRVSEVLQTDLCQEVLNGALSLRDNDFSKVVWATTEYERTLLQIEWRNGIECCIVDTIGSRLSVDSIRLLLNEPDHIAFCNIIGGDLEVETRHVSLPIGQGFQHVDYGQKYCYLQHQRVYVGKYKRVGSVGKWHQTLSEISFEGDGDGILGAISMTD